jgi:hypothetical protein
VPAPATITSSLLEPYLEDVFLELLDHRPSAARSTLHAAEHAAAKAEAALVAYRDNDRALAALGPERFAAGLEKRHDKLARALRALARARQRTHAPQLPPRRELEDRWPHMTVAERRDTLRHVIDCVFVRRGRNPVHERVVICRRGETPDDLPRRGDHHAPVRPLDPNWQSPTSSTAATEPELWSQRRIHQQLEAFTRGRTHWPPFDAFHRAGRGRLYRQLEATGGCRLWAQRLGLRHNPDTTSRRRWTDNRIRTTLAAYLADKTEFPSRRQSTADGFAAVRWAVNQHGGVDHWATEVGLPRANRQEGKRRYWTPERIQNELTAFINEHGPRPTRQTFHVHEAGPLLRALDRTGGRAAWVSRVPADGELGRTPSPR